MNAKFRIVIPASAAVAAILLTACADKPIRVPGGTFVEEPYTGETTTKTHTVISNGEEITDTEVIFIDDEVPVGPVEDKTQAGKQDGASAAQGGSSAQGGDASAQQGTTTLQPVDQDQTAKSNAPEGSVEYKVVKGDTLWGIGMVYGVSVARLAEINGIDEKAPLKVGQVLMIPPDAKNAVGKPVEKKQEKKQETKPATTSATTTTKPATATKAQPVTKDGETLYVVKSGDNLSMIAYRHHVKLADLVAANKVDPKATLRVGQTLVIPAAGAKAATTTTTKPATTTKTEPASTTKPATATSTTTKTEPATTKPATTSQTKGGEGSGGVVEPIGGSSMGGNSGSASASTSTPAPTTTTTKPATSSTASSGLASVSALDDADVISVQIDSESTLEEVANIHDRNLEDLIRLNPEFKSGQKIPAGTAVKMPLF